LKNTNLLGDANVVAQTLYYM